MEAQLFEMMLKVNAAHQYRNYCQDPSNQYGSIWTEEKNEIADQIHTIWLTGFYSKQETTLMAFENLETCPIENIIMFYERLTKTDEFLLQTKLPFLSVSKIEELLAYKNSTTPNSLKKNHQKRSSTSELRHSNPKRRKSLGQQFNLVGNEETVQNLNGLNNSHQLEPENNCDGGAQAHKN